MSDKIFDVSPIGPKVVDAEKIQENFDKVVEEQREEIVQEVAAEAKAKPKKEKKPRKAMDESTKARLLEQLARGRETSKLNRKKRAEAKKIIKKQKEDDIDEIIKQDLERKKKESQDKEFLRNELNELKDALKSLMEENKKLKTANSEEKVEKVKEDIKQVKEEIKEVSQQAKGAPVPTGVPMNANIPVARPIKVSVSKGVRSRWAKYG